MKIRIPDSNNGVFEDQVRQVIGVYHLHGRSLKQEITDWLNMIPGGCSIESQLVDKKLGDNWPHPPAKEYVFNFERKEDAMLFKLTWAGQ